MTAYLILVIIILCEVCADCDPTITINSKVGGCWRCPNYAIHNITDVLWSCGSNSEYSTPCKSKTD